MSRAIAGRSNGRPPRRLDHDPSLESPLERPLLAKRLEVDVGPLSAQKTSLTGREWKFVQELVAGEGHVTPKEAAIRAGYQAKDASAISNTLTNPKKNPHVVAAIKEFRKTLAEKYGTTYERHMRDLMVIRDKALEAGNYSAAVVAEYRRGQALGTIYIDRKEIRHGTIDSMSKEDVLRKLEEIRAVYGARPVDIQDVQVNEARAINDTRGATVPEDQDESEELSADSLGESSDAGGPRPFGSFEFEIPDDRAQDSDGPKD